MAWTIQFKQQALAYIDSIELTIIVLWASNHHLEGLQVNLVQSTQTHNCSDHQALFVPVHEAVAVNFPVSRSLNFTKILQQ